MSTATPPPQWHSRELADIYAELRTGEQGLTTAAAAAALDRYGQNHLAISSEPWWQWVTRPFQSVFILVLAVAAVISWITDEHVDSYIIVGITLVNAGIYYVQRFSTERILRNLRNKGEDRMITVLRNGQVQEVGDKFLVPGDYVLLGEGQKIPADIRIVRADSLQVDESLLTGESEPRSKSAGVLEEGEAVPERVNMLFQGSFITSGSGQGVVVGTANHTEYAAIAQLASRPAPESPVQKKVDQLITRLIGVVSAISLVIFGLSLLRGMSIAESLRVILSLAVATVPEGLPVVLIVVTVLGMKRLADQQVVVRSLQAVDDLGLVTTIATDKTGTLTENRLSVAAWSPSLNQQAHRERLLRMATGTRQDAHDPLDQALLLAVGESFPAHSELLKTYPFNQELRASGALWRHDGKIVAVIKGAPEGLAPHNDQEHFSEEIHTLAREGYRVIGLVEVSNVAEDAELEVAVAAIADQAVHLIGVADQLRHDAIDAIATAHKAGVIVRMITGDFPETAYSIGRRLGLVTSLDQVLPAAQLAEASDETVARSTVFARVLPEQKFGIIEHLAKTEVVAMTGDGVNDAPAISRAHVGIAMGDGADITKDAADIILFTNSLTSLMAALREGRTIFANVQKIVSYLITTTTSVVLLTLGALIVGLPLPLVPVQILWINLVTESTLALTLGVERAEDGVMTDPPRAADAPLLTSASLWRVAVTALTTAVVGLSLYATLLERFSQAEASSMLFLAIVITQWVNAFIARGTASVFTLIKKPNPSYWIGLAVAVILQLLAHTPLLEKALHTVPTPALTTAGIVGAMVAAVLLASEVQKRYNQSAH